MTRMNQVKTPMGTPTNGATAGFSVRRLNVIDWFVPRDIAMHWNETHVHCEPHSALNINRACCTWRQDINSDICKWMLSYWRHSQMRGKNGERQTWAEIHNALQLPNTNVHGARYCWSGWDYIRRSFMICIHHFAHLRQQCDNSKLMIFQEKRWKFMKCYTFLRVKRRHNCSPAASFTICVTTLYLLKVYLQTFLSLPITQKCQILSYDTPLSEQKSSRSRWFKFWALQIRGTRSLKPLT